MSKVEWSFQKGRLVSSKGEDVEDLARKAGTPLFIYDSKIITERVRDLRSSFGDATHIHYATKANNFPKLLGLIRSLGVGVDTVSAGEIRRAIECGFTADQCVFSGVGKTRDEITYALSEGVRSIHVESLSELKRIGEIAKSLRRTAPVLIRINPNQSVKTHRYIRTGHSEDKFGISVDQIPELRRVMHSFQELDLQGIAFHLGSQIFHKTPYLGALKKINRVFVDLAQEGFTMKTLDIGGGFGVPYNKEKPLLLKTLAKEVETFRKNLAKECRRDIGLIIEPGRFLVAESGILVAEIQYIKTAGKKTFLIVDTGMHHLIRPSLYEAYHPIEPVVKRKSPMQKYDVVGPICESGDVLGEGRAMNELREGELIAIRHAGAYGSSMSSDYNLRPRAGEILI